MNLTSARVVGYFSIPSASLAGDNPEAYANAMRGAPQGAGTCASCGMGILHHVVVALEDGQRVFIGRDCAERVGSPEMQRCVREKLTAEQLAAQDAKREAQRQEWAKREEAERERLATRAAAFADILPYLESTMNPFYRSLAEQLRRGPLSPRQAECVAKAIFGRCNKRNAEQWDSIESRCTAE